MAKIKIKTTKEDHAEALKSKCIPGMISANCFVAQAVKRVTKRSCRVGGRSMRFDDNGKVVALPDHVQDAIVAFDSKKAFTEVEWEIELEAAEPAKK